MPELRLRFLPRFLEGGRERVRTAHLACRVTDWRTVADQMHALAGEAALLGLIDVATLARACESVARQESATSDAAEKCAQGLREIEVALDLLLRPSAS
jgi:HPt (histidine-containing phosphotransfer) domain-containing protein